MNANNRTSLQSFMLQAINDHLLTNYNKKVTKKVIFLC